MKRAVVMGSLVLDIIPTLWYEDYRPIEEIFIQGKVTELRNISFSMGGCVGNTGLAMHKMGVDTTLNGKVGDDFAGNGLEMMMRKEGVNCRLTRMADYPTTCGIGITPKDIDKITLFMRGASQQYDSSDADDVPECELFHFGYPVTMERLYANEGRELENLYKAVRKRGITTSLDTALPRPDSVPGQINWRPILEKVLPYVDIFVPSIEECFFMLDREAYIQRMNEAQGADIIDTLTSEEVRSTAQQFLDMGAKVVLLKLGSAGMYLRTSSKAVPAQAGPALEGSEEAWADRELWMTPNSVDWIVSTTGAGDVAIAGFLSSILTATEPEMALLTAAKAASLCIQSVDTCSKLMTLDKIQAQAAGDEHFQKIHLPENTWRKADVEGLFIGSADKTF